MRFFVSWFSHISSLLKRLTKKSPKFTDESGTFMSFTSQFMVGSSHSLNAKKQPMTIIDHQ